MSDNGRSIKSGLTCLGAAILLGLNYCQYVNLDHLHEGLRWSYLSDRVSIFTHCCHSLVWQTFIAHFCYKKLECSSAEKGTKQREFQKNILPVQDFNIKGTVTERKMQRIARFLLQSFAGFTAQNILYSSLNRDSVLLSGFSDWLPLTKRRCEWKVGGTRSLFLRWPY